MDLKMTLADRNNFEVSAPELDPTETTLIALVTAWLNAIQAEDYGQADVDRIADALRASTDTLEATVTDAAPDVFPPSS